MKKDIIASAVFAISLSASPVIYADCWRLPNGQALTTNAGSTPPVSGARRTQCIGQQQQQVADPCANYYGRGYCTDYIQERIGRKPSGDAGTWSGNTPIASIRAGDIAIFAVGTSGHVAYVEEVITDKSTGRPVQIRISEKNWGAVLSGQENQRCIITSNFGKIGMRTVPISSVAKVWRP